MAGPMLLIAWAMDEAVLMALSLILATGSGATMVWAIKADWAPSPTFWRWLNILTLGQLQSWSREK